MNMSATEILQKHDLRKTAIRLQMLEIFFVTSHAVTANGLEESLANFDRVTIYRTLQTFLEKNILHKIPDESGTARFALIKSSYSTKEATNADHVHFKCQRCQVTRCIEDIAVPIINLPKGYLVDHISYLVQGTCPNCS